ncbi:MAG: TIM-barrel domain-containing protein [Fidelibacterota bacterium]
MYKKIILLSLLAFFLQNALAFQKNGNQIIFDLEPQKTTDVAKLKIEVLRDDIIRVVASPEDVFSQRPSLMVDKTDWKTVDFDVKVTGEMVTISTKILKVQVNDKTGEISFLDKTGKPILKEKSGGGKTTTPAEVMGEQTYHIRQVFESPEDEALYGLGQHQNGIINWKGHDVDLWQYNIVASVPFLVSNKNYGLLWDNNSRTKFGDPRDYQPITELKLYGKDGKPGGLTAEFFKDKDFSDLLTTEKTDHINYAYLDDRDEFPAGFVSEEGSIRWSGEIESDEEGIHKFRLYSSYYTKVWLDGELVVDNWRQNWLPWTHNLRLNMEKGKRYKIKIQWIPGGGYMGLTYLTPANPELKDQISLYSNVGDQIDYYFIYGKKTDDIISGYRTITGQAAMMPKWAMGLWQCRECYKTQKELMDVVKEFREREIPLDNIVQDWNYWPEDQWGSHDFDKNRFPNPEGMIKKLHEKYNINIMISVWPKFYEGIDHYEEFRKNGWLYMRNIEKRERDWIGDGYVSTFYDPYAEGARKLFWDQINEKLFSKGIDAWWLDATEPDIHSNLSLPEWQRRIGPTSLGSAARYLNTYSLMNAKGIYNGQRETDPDKRVFILTRSGFAGQQRYAAVTWSGDVVSRWEDLKDQIPAGLNLCMAGLPYWTTDIGGFAVEPRYENPNEEDLAEWRELNTRWFQYGTFTPLFRVHGQFPYREMWNIAPKGHPAYETMVAYDKLRYRLMPYIYSLTGMVTQEDYTIMRGLVMDFGDDEKVLNIADQFMFGPSLLINPVTDYKARSRGVYLPESKGWYDFKSGKFYKAGQTITADAPYTEMPMFVKAGSILPFGPEIQYTDEKPADPILLYIYTGDDAEFKLYEDENTNYNYEKGLFSVIPFIYDENTKELTIGKSQGEFPGMLKERIIKIVWVSKDEPRELDYDVEADAVVNYKGKKVVVKMK